MESKETKTIIIEQIPLRVYAMISGVYFECIPEAILRKIAVRKKGRITEALLQAFLEKYMLNINSKCLIVTDLSRNLSEDGKKNRPSAEMIPEFLPRTFVYELF